MDDYLSKPPQAAQLQAMLARYLARPSEKPTVGFFSHRVKVLVRWRAEPERQAPPNGAPEISWLFCFDLTCEWLSGRSIRGSKPTCLIPLTPRPFFVPVRLPIGSIRETQTRFA